MKKLISYILLSVFLLIATSPFNVLSAETDWSGELTTNGNNINVTVSAPQSETQIITSLHCKVYISIASGKMDAPTFQFSSTVESKITDVAAIIDDSSNYVLDIVLSGTKDQNIFKTSKQANIGTIVLHPTTSNYKITAEFMGMTSDNKEPAAEYVTSDGYLAEEVPLVNTKSVNIEKATGTSGSGSGFGGISSTPAPVPTATTSAVSSAVPSMAPNNTETPVTSAIPVITETPITTETPDDTKDLVTFDSLKKITLKGSVKKGSRYVKLAWDKIDGADGYIIYNKTNAKYKNIRTISNPEKMVCSLKMSYAVSYSFRVCAFKNLDDGSKIYGKYSNVIKITTAPVKVRGLKVKRVGKSKISISWKKVKRANGYQIFSSKKKNGQYTFVKIIRKGSTLSTKVKQRGKRTYYYKVRAYVNDANKKRVYGNFGKSLAAKP